MMKYLIEKHQGFGVFAYCHYISVAGTPVSTPGKVLRTDQSLQPEFSGRSVIDAARKALDESSLYAYQSLFSAVDQPARPSILL